MFYRLLLLYFPPDQKPRYTSNFKMSERLEDLGITYNSMELDTDFKPDPDHGDRAIRTHLCKYTLTSTVAGHMSYQS